MDQDGNMQVMVDMEGEQQEQQQYMDDGQQ